MSRLLTDAGAECTHEKVFRVQVRDADVVARETGAVGESSSLAVPRLPLDGVTVVHLIRSPLDVVASLTARGLLTDKTSVGRFMLAQVPEAAEYPHGPKRAAVFWLAWNAMAARVADVTWRVGEITGHDVMGLSDRCALGLSRADVDRAFRGVPRNVNAFPHAPLELDALEELADPVARAAEIYQVSIAEEGP